MEVIKINCKGEFYLLVKDIDLTRPHTFVYSTTYGENYVVQWSGTEGINCVKAGNELKVIFQNHQLGTGQLYVEHHAIIGDVDFAKGSYSEVNKIALPVRLTNDVTDNAEAIQVMPITALSYSAWSESEKTELAKGITSQFVEGEKSFITFEEGVLYMNLPT